MAEIDPVCNMTVEPQKAAATSEYQGKTYYFCSRGCKVVFDRDPDKWLHMPADKKGMHGH